jgi:integrase
VTVQTIVGNVQLAVGKPLEKNGGLLSSSTCVNGRFHPPGFVSPTRGVPRHPDEIRRVYVTDEEMAKLRLLARTSFRDRRFGLYVAMLADSGARKGEILPRKWSELDIEGRRLVLATSKNGAPRTLWFSAETMALAAKLKPARDGLIFPSTRVPNCPMNFRCMWMNLTKMAGLPSLHLHDLRHVVAASLLGSGVSIAITAAVLGHKSHIMTTSRYGHLSQELVGSVMADRFSTTTAPRN